MQNTRKIREKSKYEIASRGGLPMCCVSLSLKREWDFSMRQRLESNFELVQFLLWGKHFTSYLINVRMLKNKFWTLLSAWLLYFRKMRSCQEFQMLPHFTSLSKHITIYTCHPQLDIYSNIIINMINKVGIVSGQSHIIQVDSTRASCQEAMRKRQWQRQRHRQIHLHVLYFWNPDQAFQVI